MGVASNLQFEAEYGGHTLRTGACLISAVLMGGDARALCALACQPLAFQPKAQRAHGALCEVFS